MKEEKPEETNKVVFLVDSSYGDNTCYSTFSNPNMAHKINSRFKRVGKFDVILADASSKDSNHILAYQTYGIPAAEDGRCAYVTPEVLVSIVGHRPLRVSLRNGTYGDGKKKYLKQLDLWDAIGKYVDACVPVVVVEKNGRKVELLPAVAADRMMQMEQHMASAEFAIEMINARLDKMDGKTDNQMLLALATNVGKLTSDMAAMMELVALQKSRQIPAFNVSDAGITAIANKEGTAHAVQMA